MGDWATCVAGKQTIDTPMGQALINFIPALKLATTTMSDDSCCKDLTGEDKERCDKAEGERFSNTNGGTMHIFNILIILFSLYLYKKCNSKFNAGELCWACCCPLCYIMYKMAFDDCLK
tara:strand:+ start:886 stop:1242 length:357 start_codon:yes stop_codon:yes gene_type:complete